MRTATVRDLRTRFPRLKRDLEREGEIIVTDRGRPAFVLRVYAPPPKRRGSADFDYFARLRSRQPKALSARASRSLDEDDRADR